MAIVKPRQTTDTTLTELDSINEIEINLLHMYPQDMNIYGDLGNVTTLKKRLLWRGFKCNIYNLNKNNIITSENNEVVSKEINDFDIFFMGGGQDLDQLDIFKDLITHKEDLVQAVESNKVFLLICGGYQLFGKKFLTIGNKEIEGLGILDIETIGGDNRCIGNIVVECTLPELKGTKLVGFENHSGRTRILSNKVKTIGKILHGTGNSEFGGEEGGYYRQVYGCYIHGSFLPKNPEFADFLIKKAITNKYGNREYHFPDLDNYVENLAKDKIIKRFEKE